MSEIINDKWINIDEGATYLGVKPVTVRDWIRKDKGIPAHKIGNLKSQSLIIELKAGKVL